MTLVLGRYDWWCFFDYACVELILDDCVVAVHDFRFFAEAANQAGKSSFGKLVVGREVVARFPRPSNFVASSVVSLNGLAEDVHGSGFIVGLVG